MVNQVVFVCSYLYVRGESVRMFGSIRIRVFLLTLIAGCFTLSTTTESWAAEELKSDPQKVMENAVSAEPHGKPVFTDKTFEFVLSAGYRKDKLNWNEAGPPANIMSELKWENLNIAQISAAARLNFYSDWSVCGELGYGRINSGNNQDSDYAGNNRTLEWSRSNNRGGGEVRYASIGLGRTLRIWDRAGYVLSATPLVGVSINQQNLTTTDGFQAIGTPPGPFPGLKNSYDAKWQGHWLGIDAMLESGERWLLSATAEYHSADYSAQAYWNLRNFSFVHTATGQGIVLAAKAAYLIGKDWRAGLTMQAQQWHTGAGVDRTAYSNGSVGYYPLNEVNWQSSAINFEMVYLF